MNIRVNIAIMSHLSDAQAMLDFGLKKEANSEINLAKAILLAHPNTDDWTTEDELNEIVSRSRQERYGTQNEDGNPRHPRMGYFLPGIWGV